MKIVKTALFIFLILAAIVIALVTYSCEDDWCYFFPWQGRGQTVCTMDAKLCPDGSYVGRSGASCEFKACP